MSFEPAEADSSLSWQRTNIERHIHRPAECCSATNSMAHMPVATLKEVSDPVSEQASQFAKGAHLRAVDGELRPVALLSGGWRTRRLRDSG